MPSIQLIDALWGEIPPRTARKNLQVYVSALRKIVGDRIDFQGWGYSFRAERDEVDLLRFQEAARTGRGAIRGGAPAVAAELLGEAVGLWRDQPLAEFSHVPLVSRDVGRFTELFLSVYEDWAELEIELGRHVEVLSGLDLVAARYPTRERIAAARMTALARCGRTSEALSHFESLRRHLSAEMGIDPSPVLRSLYQDILRGSGTPAPAPRGGAAPAKPLQAGANQLPRDITDFVGREREMRRIADDPSPVTLITGDLGIGKTTLAVHVAHTLAPMFPDGAVVLPLRRRGGAPRPTAEIQRELLEAVGVSVPGVRGEDVLASVWRSWLANRRLLLILDDAPDEAAVRALLPGAGASRVLVTSRSRLSGLESVTRIGLGELSHEEGIEFLRRVIGADRVRGDVTAVTAMLDRYGLSPLILRVLGGRFAGLPHVPLARLAERLGRAECVLDEFVAGDLSLRERFEDGYNRPTWTPWEAFRTLGALGPPPFSHDELVDTLDGTLDGTGMRAERVIESLLEANILSVPDYEVTAHAMLYTMSPLAHRFAVELHLGGA
ncbi:DNA-binding SARP family transcriptional activator [Sphaerisporangium rubeum]|uniref:DNA-binding SARP family transcriptional activator n=1 Tax=Sphaerisporangium rubeum TaxID=321317 RepID=A0A7X0IDW0_9ACTN|nr:DNA-binding SARP family transcriptional activator [Sphaerisporangium rubeum]